MEIEERIAYSDCIIFDTSTGSHYKAMKMPVYDNPLAKGTYDGKWELSLATYHSHRFGKPLKIRVQSPRWKRQGYFESPDECRKFITAAEHPLHTDRGTVRPCR